MRTILTPGPGRRRPSLSWIGAAALFAACARFPEPGALDEGSPVAEVPSDFRGEHVLVATELAGADTAWLILDSGAQLAVLDDDVADRLPHARSGRSRLTGYGDSVAQGDLLVDLAVGLPGTLPFTTTVPVVDLDPLAAFAGYPLAGFLGAPVFARFVVEIDYGARRVRLHDARRFRPASSDVRVPLEVERGTPVVRAELVLADGSRLGGRFVVDTGLRGAISLAAPFVERHDLATRTTPTVPHRAGGIGGLAEERIGRVRTFRIGPFALDAPTVQLSAARSGAAAEEDRAGAIGGELLGRFVVTLDFRGGAMYLRPGAMLDEPFEADMSGASFKATPGLAAIIVDHVDAGSAAAAAGLREGDLVLEVDGRSDTPLWQLRALLRSEAGRTIRLLVRNARDNASHDRELLLTLERRV